MEKKRLTVIFTCFNRKEKTKNCMESLLAQREKLDISFVIVDDNSSDGTVEALEKMRLNGTQIDVLHGSGSLYWAGGMRKGIEYAKEHTDTEYYLLINDDVQFYPNAIPKMVEELEALRKSMKKAVVLVGAMQDEAGAFSYGGIRYQKGIHYETVKPEDTNRSCDSFNMNCLLMEKETFLDVPNFDIHYVHSLADFDYGLEMKRRGIPLYVAKNYAGKCSDNDPAGGWTDCTLSRRERLKKKESVKGAPFKPWFYFLKKNFGIGQALLHAFTPYLRIILGR